MALVRETNWSALLVLLSCFCLEFGSAADTITAAKFIKDRETIISDGGKFKLGFFSPEILPIAMLEYDGNLVVLDSQKRTLWTSNVTNSVSNSSAQLLDSGNFVLKENTTGIVMWESFQNPSDTFLQKMKVSTNVKTGNKVQLTSWKSPSDPSTGTFSAGIDFHSLPEIFIWNASSPYWRSGPWNGQIFIGIPNMNSVYLDGFALVDDKEGTYYLDFAFSNDSVISNFVLKSQGNIVQPYYNGENWEVGWSSLESECDVYGKCGAFGSCNSQNSPACSCLRGFEPKNIEEWNRENWTSGCVRRTPLQCERVKTGGEGKQDGFLKLKTMKVPAFADWSSAFEDKCRTQCLENCSCLAYAYDSGIGCMSWTGNLTDLQKFSSGGVDFYVRVAYSELARKKEKEMPLFNKSQEYPNFPDEKNLGDNISHVKLEELPVFRLKELASATNNFHHSNKLGQGGFGPVYRRLYVPEYAMEGRFSEKSDVFSFGVLFLEMISGRRNTSFYQDEQNISLLAFAFSGVLQKGRYMGLLTAATKTATKGDDDDNDGDGDGDGADGVGVDGTSADGTAND
ncbi:hypothetical protein CJ030_MR0G022774 [Morella rubra]|uniref:Uncharacterized protein n=1 Tax=Morella rubra TaxID=262757 RepID=A0A6A1UGR8_9ROSI|nr:hypothetical protein CJ030_MR0G022774 [Morella rubra]